MQHFCLQTFDFVGLQIWWECFKNEIRNWKICTYSHVAKICNSESPAIYHFSKPVRTALSMIGFLPVPKPLGSCREQLPKIVWLCFSNVKSGHLRQIGLMCKWEEVRPVQGTAEISGVFQQCKGSLPLTSQKVPVDGTTLHQQGVSKIVP